MRIPEVQVRIPSRGMGTFFLHTVSSIFRLFLTHTHTHTHTPQESQSNVDQQRRIREEFWIRELGTLDPYGLNDKIQSWGSLSQKSQGSLIVTYSLFNKHVHRPHSRHTTGKRRARARHRLFDPHSFLAEMSSSMSTETCFLHDTPGAYTGGFTVANEPPLEVSSFVSKSTACALTACEHVFAIENTGVFRMRMRRSFNFQGSARCRACKTVTCSSGRRVTDKIRCLGAARADHFAGAKR